MLIASDQKKIILHLESGKAYETHRGIFEHDDLIGVPWGSEIETHLGYRYDIVQPTLRDILLQIRRRSQIIFPKDIGYILLRLSVAPGRTYVEVGTGSGALTTALAWAVGATGKVISYDRRKDMQDLARQNLERIGLLDRVDLRLKDIAEGLEVEDADGLFLDLPEPHLVLSQAKGALVNGGPMGAIVPTANQVSELISALREHHFRDIEVCEILLRFYKTIPERLRPEDRMVAHTGYLVFCRSRKPAAERS